MKALILDAMPEQMRSTTEAIEKEAKSLGIEVATLNLMDTNMKKCIGCFVCWEKTPGVCVHDDDGKKMAMEWPHADIIIYSTPVFLGSYSPELKVQLDRILPILQPYFRKFDGEVHHPQRYPRKKALIAFGQLTSKDDDEGRTFKELVRRNSLNMQTRFCEVITFREELDKAATAAVFNKAKEALA
ncbi:MAG: flavodoxin family protein [Syntrophobacteraceae bacterium]|nr:flavodoxin family protein [Syntrophobacteraceae bacterium]